MTPSESAKLQAKVLAAARAKAPPSPVAAPPASAPAPAPVPNANQAADDLWNSLPAAWRPRTVTNSPLAQSFAASMGDAMGRQQFGALQQEAKAQGPTEPDPVTVGDVLDSDPEELERAGLTQGASLARQVYSAVQAPRLGGISDSRASPFSAEPGAQKLEDLRMVPLQRMTGQFGASPAEFETAIADLYFQREARRAGLQRIGDMTPDQYGSLLERSKKYARAQVASTMGLSERRGNVLANLDDEQAVTDTRAGRNLPLPIYATPVGAAALGAQAIEALGGPKAEDQPISALMAPFWAMARPASYEVESGSRVASAQKEGRISWFFRLAPSTAIGSWLLDPDLEWSLGGDKGFGGKEHVQKIMRGYDLTQDIPNVGERWDELTPWQSSWIEKAVAGTIPIGAAILLEPDIPSLAMGIVGAPIAKGLRELGAGAYVVNHVYEPALKAWRKLLEDGKSIDEVVAAMGPLGSTERQIAESVLQKAEADTARKAASTIGPVGEHGGKMGPEVANLDLLNVRNLDVQQAKAADRLSKAEDASILQRDRLTSARPMLASETAREVSAAARATRVAQQAADAAHQAEVFAWSTEAGEINKAHTAARVAFQDAEQQMVAHTAIRGMDKAAAGDRVVNLADEAVYTFEKTDAAGVHLVADDGTRLVVPNARQFRVLAKAGNPADTKTILRELEALKQRRARLISAREAAVSAGDMAEANRITLQLQGLRSRIIQNLRTADFLSSAHDYVVARRMLVQTSREMADHIAKRPPIAPAAVPAVAPAVTNAIKHLQAEIASATAKLGPAESAEMVARTQSEALDSFRQTLIESIDRHLQAIDEWRKLRAAPAPTMGKGVLAEATSGTPGALVVDRDRWVQGMVSRYGSDATDAVLASPVGRAAKAATSGPITAKGWQELRDVEKAVFNEAAARRATLAAPVTRTLATLGEFRGMRLNTREGWIARSYQLADRLRRAGDWVGGSAIGRAPEQIREVARRSFERFTTTEREIGEVGKEGGIKAIRDFLTSSARFGRALSNQDSMTLADKAVAYLRAIAQHPDAWDSDVVVEALKNAPLPSWRAARAAPRQVGAALQAMLEDPGFSGAELERWIEEIAPAIYQRQVGKTDNPDVLFRFMARAIAQAANQHDVMFDLMRTTGPGLGADAAKALNWMNVPERSAFGLLDVEAGWRGAATFGIPGLKEQRGALQTLFTARKVSAELMAAATLHGHDIYISRAAWEALQDVPRKLAKDMAEFKEAPNWLLSGFDKFARLWRVATVNGYILPKASHFVNTFAGDWSQAVTVLGWRRGTRLALQNFVAYMPFVGPALQSKLSEMAAHPKSILGTIFNPLLSRVAEGDPHLVVPTAEGPMDAQRFLREAFEDGTHDSISTNDLAEITARHGFEKSWFDAPAHIEATARFMETIQHRNRLALYLEARTSMGLSREEARKLLVNTLYDWKTGAPEWEKGFITRLVSFWMYRRAMFRQLGASLTEGITRPSEAFFAKALTGRTELARMRQAGKALSALPDVIYWDDPNEYLDDPQQLHALGLRTAPWWVDNEVWFGNRQVTPETKLWYSEVAGRDVTYETLMLPTMTTMDQLWMLNLVMQTAGATAVGAATQAGLASNVTSADISTIWARNVDALADMMMPGIDDAVGGALKTLAGLEQDSSDRGILIPQAEAIML